jgi:hypothetical protein
MPPPLSQQMAGKEIQLPGVAKFSCELNLAGLRELKFCPFAAAFGYIYMYVVGPL